ncbi:MAG: hypothetical protein ACJA1A_003278 [Saprospiraceae bacterium]|jgi:hypothetical protein|tara:strand:+ start:615 stop:1634 length:1020 start_codon:yes stop_codon:yes gene_type:complete
MKKLLILLAFLIGLAAVAYLLKPQNDGPKTSMDTTDRNFAFPEDQMGMVTVKSKDRALQTFKRGKGGIWTLNDKYKVSQFTLPQITKTLSNIKVQNIPSKGETESILKDIAKVGIQIKIYDLDLKEVRSFQIGLESYDESGTAFLMDGATQPYNMFLSGLYGDVRTRFTQEVDRYRDREMFQYVAEDIKEVSINYHKDQKSSFKLTVAGSEYKVEPLSQFLQPTTKSVSPDRVMAYLGGFSRIYAEDFDNSNVRLDSIRALVPFATVTVKDKNGSINEIDFIPFKDIITRNSNTRDIDQARKIERFFINKTTDGNYDFMVAQNRLVQPVFRGYGYFFGE